MANLTTIEKSILEKAFNMGGGWFLDFSDRTMAEFFIDDLNIDIDDLKYNYGTGSKANRMRGFWIISDNGIVSGAILKIIEYIENKILIGDLDEKDYPSPILEKSKEIAIDLNNREGKSKNIIQTQANIIDGNINIKLQVDIFSHVQSLMESGHYFTAVEESYKIVRKKLKEITGKERAHEAFKTENYIKIFGHEPVNDAEKDFFEGVKFLNMAIQFLRNEKAHTPAQELDKNLAIHYIVLASLAYDLITRNSKIEEITDLPF